MTHARNLSNRSTDFVSVKDFGAVGDGTTDDTAAIAAAWSASKYITFPAGTYKVSSLPNFASNGARIETVGKVTINYTGAGNGLTVDSGSGAGVKNYDIQIGPMTIVGSASAQNGVYIRGITHSVFKRLRPINFPLSAMRCEFMVSNSFEEFCYSGNEAGITVATAKGIILEKRNAGEQSSDCTFINPIIEGTTGDGIYGPEAAQCTFIGGTSEGNGAGGGAGAVYLGVNSFGNTFIGLDMESNGKAADATSYQVKNYGLRNKFITPFCDSTISGLFWAAGGNSLSIEGGQIADLKIDAGVRNTNTLGVAYTGTITDNGTDTRRIQEFYIVTNATLADSQITFGTWTPTATNLTSSTTAVLTGSYQKVGRMVYFTIYVTATGGGNTTASSANFSAPFSQLSSAPGTSTTANNGTAAGIGNNAIFSNLIYCQNWAAQATMIVSGSYLTAS